MAEELWDVVIIGAGPAGLAAAIYAARDRCKAVVVDKFMAGGQITTTNRIENYPGIERIDGQTLIETMQRQAETFGAQILAGREVTSLKRRPDGLIHLSCGQENYVSRAVIVAVGSTYRKLGIPGEEEFRNAGAGVSYCGTCDAPFFRDKQVVTVGGGNTAIEETLHLTKYARKVTLVHRRDEFRASKVMVEELSAKAAEPNSNLIVRTRSLPLAVQGKGRVESVRLKDTATDREEDYPCDGVFIFVGTVPGTGFLKGFVNMTPAGFIECDGMFLRTSVPGVFVAGDCRVGAAMQLATAVGDGVNAAVLLKEHFRSPAWWTQPVSASEGY
jgi:thioredoxin reductase (NADPH)